LTSRGLVLLPAALLDSAFSLAFSLRRWITHAISPAAAELAWSTRSHSLPPVRPFGFSATVDQFDRPPGAGHAPASPEARRSCLYSLPPLAAGAGRSSSSRAQQIPLLVGGLKALYSALRNAVFPTRLQRFGRKSLNPTLSLHGGVA
jgi:hypothetical protein